MAMDIWTYRRPVTGVELTGFSVEALDGSIGKVDRATYETGAGLLVIDTGPWIFGQKVMLPAGTVSEIDVEGERIFVDRTKDEIRNAPEFDPDRYEEPVYREKLGGYYEPFYRS